ncbi:MAG: hypothetical protein COX07_00330 [Bacteroidetes bacterium CG23_combo_of_CG06-09_8_20_14_all_32_9]|nr:MAG: hypothetical protein COX07_00330 [Bacteroidetes bacterium CG23_combo_of_CG06-09_8_20_14_all_32_9]
MKKIILQLLFILIIFISAVGQNQNISNGIVFDGEPYLSINPNNSQHIVVAWMDYAWVYQKIFIKTRVSFDGGLTWSLPVSITHTNPNYGSADPSLGFDSFGNVFLSYIDFDVSIDSGSVYVRKSIDGGLNWGIPAEVINVHSDGDKKPVDRPWIIIDRSGGPHNGNIYITTMNPNVFGTIPPPYNPYFIRSTNGGISFDQWRYIDTTGWLAGTIIPQPTPFSTISQNGKFYCVYPSWVLSQNLNPQFILASSDNAGNSFTYKKIIELPYNIIVSDTLIKKGYPLIADPTDTNHLVFFELITPYGDADVFMWETYDGGITWSNSIRINDDPVDNNRMQDLIWADFDTDGDLVVSWRDRRNAPDSNYATSSEIWGAARYKDSTNFSPNFRISDTIVNYDSVLAQVGNDFMCIKLINDTLSVVWGDVRTGRLNIWFQRMTLNGAIVSVYQLASENIPSAKIFPNPITNSIFIEAKKMKQVTIYDLNGNIVLIRDITQKEENTIIDLTQLLKGTYLIGIITEDGIMTKKIIKQ